MDLLHRRGVLLAIHDSDDQRALGQLLSDAIKSPEFAEELRLKIAREERERHLRDLRNVSPGRVSVRHEPDSEEHRRAWDRRRTQRYLSDAIWAHMCRAAGNTETLARHNLRMREIVERANAREAAEAKTLTPAGV
ncbi:hypothetical protein EVJ50_06745 [Synechococcus sp. RSCCF101]|uniref:hypothetical protein n=1 Tax=Synechococcus sp. RSCCF101 TaxID=2511069 RepID=UPI001247E015|nr:hypothetical protein [Synechococcus sp. RSCCF101]QEY31978.1 hypothetical protein EVJ50_06745 [Synechococcus sp. RSCCF101]